MTRDRGYPDWLVLSARLLAQPSCGQVGGAKYICFGCVWLVAMCRYYSLLLCVVIFVTKGICVCPPGKNTLAHLRIIVSSKTSCIKTRQ